MNDKQRSWAGIAFSLLIVGCAAFVVQRFFLPLVWAGILSIATWPLYCRLLVWSGGRTVPTALLLTAVMVCLFVMPAIVGVEQALENAPRFASFVVAANNDGIAPPALLTRIPLIGDDVLHWWAATLGQPHGLSHLVSGKDAANQLHSASDLLRNFGTKLFHRLIDFGFAFLCLFFFYKDGRELERQIQKTGSQVIGHARWDNYYQKIPTAIRATVNGLVLVGLGEGVLIGIGYALGGLPSAALWGLLTGVLAIIPFGAPVVFLTAAGVLAAAGNTIAAIAIVLWGTVVLLTADHVIRPAIIGNATRLPFIAVLFGILGGIETLGLVGLFIGPVAMVMLVTLWRASADTSASPPAENDDARDHTKPR